MTTKKYYQKHQDRLKCEALACYYVNRQDPKWVEAERERQRNYGPIRRQHRKEWIKEVKSNLHCLHCGMNRIECLDFHHRNPNEKEAHVSAILQRWGKKRILAEITKCDVLCANCHRTFHFQEKENARS